MFEPQDISHAFLVIIATNQPEVNQHVKDSLPEGTLLNHAADASAGNVTFPSMLRRGKLTISVSTDGASPKLGRQIISTLQDTYDERYESYVDFYMKVDNLLKHQR